MISNNSITDLYTWINLRQHHRLLLAKTNKTPPRGKMTARRFYLMQLQPGQDKCNPAMFGNCCVNLLNLWPPPRLRCGRCVCRPLDTQTHKHAASKHTCSKYVLPVGVYKSINRWRRCLCAIAFFTFINYSFSEPMYRTSNIDERSNTVIQYCGVRKNKKNNKEYMQEM